MDIQLGKRINFWKIYYKIYKKCDVPKKQKREFIQILKEYEYCHLMFIKLTGNEEKTKQNKQLFFYHLVNGNIIEIVHVQTD